MMVLLLDLRMDRSLIRFFWAWICYSSSRMVSLRLLNYFYSYLFLSITFFSRFYYSFSLSPRFWVWIWYFVIFSPFFSRFYFVWLSSSCFIRSHSFFRSSKF
jgi:hypothetical protein